MTDHIPTVNPKGTPKDELHQQCTAAYEAIMQAYATVQKMQPLLRDYPTSRLDFKLARERHKTWLDGLALVAGAINNIAIQISLQKLK